MIKFHNYGKQLILRWFIKFINHPYQITWPNHRNSIHKPTSPKDSLFDFFFKKTSKYCFIWAFNREPLVVRSWRRGEDESIDKIELTLELNLWNVGINPIEIPADIAKNDSYPIYQSKPENDPEVDPTLNRKWLQRYFWVIKSMI